jgi:hypothetical protein
LFLHLPKDQFHVAECVVGGLCATAVHDHALQSRSLLFDALLGFADRWIAEDNVVKSGQRGY